MRFDCFDISRAVFISLSFGYALIAYPERISPEEALSRVLPVSGNQEVHRMPSDADAPCLMSEATDAIYAFRFNDGRTMYLSSDAEAAPLLAVTYGGSDLPEPARRLLKAMEEEIREGLQGNSKLQVEADWKSVVPLMSTTWGQNKPYNSKCPGMKEDDRWPAGCTPVAVAQVMKYHKYPTSGIVENVTYDYSVMPDRLDAYSDKSQIDEVAQLILDCGNLLGTQWRSHESSTDLANIANLCLKAGFDKGMKYTPVRVVGFNKWQTDVYNDIAAGLPVLISGGGHHWVCDGYMDEGLFHMNWGWDGSGDGYYRFSAYGDSGIKYASDLVAVTGIRPDCGTPAATDPGITAFSDFGIGIVNGGFSDKSWYTVFGTFGFSEPSFSTAGKIEVGLKARNEATGQTEIYYDSYNMMYDAARPVLGWGPAYMRTSLPSTDGTYILTPVWRWYESGSEWKDVALSCYGPQYVKVKVKDGKRTLFPDSYENELVVENITLLDTPVQHREFRAKVDLMNPSDRELEKEISLNIGEESTTVFMQPGERRSVVLKGKPGAYTDPGKFLLGVWGPVNTFIEDGNRYKTDVKILSGKYVEIDILPYDGVDKIVPGSVSLEMSDPEFGVEDKSDVRARLRFTVEKGCIDVNDNIMAMASIRDAGGKYIDSPLARIISSDKTLVRDGETAEVTIGFDASQATGGEKVDVGVYLWTGVGIENGKPTSELLEEHQLWTSSYIYYPDEPVCSAPEIKVDGGVVSVDFVDNTSVPGPMNLCFTLDGSDPGIVEYGESETAFMYAAYDGKFGDFYPWMTYNCTVADMKFRTWKPGCRPSEIVTAHFDARVHEPEITQDSEGYIHISENDGEQIHYTLDGTVPEIENIDECEYYFGPFRVDNDCVVTAVAMRGYMQPSKPVTFNASATSITDIASEDEYKDALWFTADGIPVDGPVRGVNIVRLRNGEVKKVIR